MKVKVTVYDVYDLRALNDDNPMRNVKVGEEQLEIEDNNLYPNCIVNEGVTLARKILRKAFFKRDGRTAMGIGIYELEILEGDKSLLRKDDLKGKVILTKEDVYPCPLYPITAQVDGIFLYVYVDEFGCIRVHTHPSYRPSHYYSVGKMAADLACRFPDRNVVISCYAVPYIWKRFIVKINDETHSNEEFIIMRQWNRQRKIFEYKVDGKTYDEHEKAMKIAIEAIDKAVKESNDRWDKVQIKLEEVPYPYQKKGESEN